MHAPSPCLITLFPSPQLVLSPPPRAPSCRPQFFPVRASAATFQVLSQGKGFFIVAICCHHNRARTKAGRPSPEWCTSAVLTKVENYSLTLRPAPCALPAWDRIGPLLWTLQKNFVLLCRCSSSDAKRRNERTNRPPLLPNFF